MNDAQLIAILSAILSVRSGDPPEAHFYEAIALAGAAQRCVDDSKKTTRLKIEYAVATEHPETRG
jgi:hypothetical protein